MSPNTAACSLPILFFFGTVIKLSATFLKACINVYKIFRVFLFKLNGFGWGVLLFAWRIVGLVCFRGAVLIAVLSYTHDEKAEVLSSIALSGQKTVDNCRY